MTVHASRELRDAMLGVAPVAISQWAETPIHIRYAMLDPVCGADTDDDCANAYAPATSETAPASHAEDASTFDCPGCLKAIRASLPEETLVRLDYLETRLPPPRCPSCDFGPFIPMREADGFNHRAVAGSTHVCTACGKGWRP